MKCDCASTFTGGARRGSEDVTLPPRSTDGHARPPSRSPTVPASVRQLASRDPRPSAHRGSAAVARRRCTHDRRPARTRPAEADQRRPDEDRRRRDRRAPSCMRSVAFARARWTSGQRAQHELRGVGGDRRAHAIGVRPASPFTNGVAHTVPSTRHTLFEPSSTPCGSRSRTVSSTSNDALFSGLLPSNVVVPRHRAAVVITRSPSSSAIGDDVTGESSAVQLSGRGRRRQRRGARRLRSHAASSASVAPFHRGHDG